VHLRYVEGLSQQDITEVLQIEGATGARPAPALSAQARQGLRQELTAMGHGSSFFQKTS